MKKYLPILVIMFFFSFAAVNCVLLYMSLSSGNQQAQTIVIERGKSTHQISNMLAEAGVIKYPSLFNFVAKVSGLLGYHLRSGEYAFMASVTPLQVLRIIVSGQSVVHKFTVVEGATVNEIIASIKKEPLLIGELDDNITEGFLMPATYFFSFGDSKQKLLSQMKRNMSDALDELMPQLAQDSPLKDRIALLTMASIVEKEAYLESEKAHIAAVFLNRLKIGMKLQADPTTIYAITLGKYKLSRPLSRADLRMKSPYNTYYVLGLPPSPIACPSRSSIEAVVKPMKSDDLYFVVNGLGGHNFSKTLQAHNDNVANYKKSETKAKID
jgi:UPF0755 protein